MSKAVNKRKEIFISVPHVGCVWYDMAFISLQQSNSRVEMATSIQKGPAGSSVPRRQRRRWCPANSVLLPAARMMPSLNNRHNKSTAGREMEGENRLEGVHVRFLNKMEAGLRSGGVEIQTFGRKRQLRFRCDFILSAFSFHATQHSNSF